jgi:diadenosine tetraphosphate (Ap4A) HIT family hydrolase
MFSERTFALGYHVSAEQCPFCTLPSERVWLANDHAVAFRDGFPISPGHTLVIPRRHYASVFEVPPEVSTALWRLVAEVRGALAAEVSPDGFNVGVNDGIAAGQTVMHGHVHVIPRLDGDVPDPRGGIRWVVPDKAVYWDQE